MSVGFFEEEAGVRSMTRLAIFVLLVLAVVLVGAIVGYVFIVKEPNAAIVGALSGALTAVVLNGAVAIIKRNGGSDDVQ